METFGGKSIWFHDYMFVDNTYGYVPDDKSLDLLVKKGFKEVYINNTDGLVKNSFIKKLRKRNFKIYQWILGPKERNKTIEVPLKDRDGVIFDLETGYQEGDLQRLIKKWCKNGDKVHLCVPNLFYGIDLYFNYKGYNKAVSEAHLNGIDKILVMSYTSYIPTLFEHNFIKYDILKIQKLTPLKVVPIFAVYDYEFPIKYKLIYDYNYSRLKKIEDQFSEISYFSWCKSFEMKLKGLDTTLKDELNSLKDLFQAYS